MVVEAQEIKMKTSVRNQLRQVVLLLAARYQQLSVHAVKENSVVENRNHFDI